MDIKTIEVEIIRPEISSEAQLAEMTLYLVRNSEGKFFRAKGYGGYVDTWVVDPNRAKLYTKIGQAKARCTWFASHYPTYPAPQIIKLLVGSTFEVVDVTEHVRKSQRNKERRKVTQARGILREKIKSHERAIAQMDRELAQLKAKEQEDDRSGTR